MSKGFPADFKHPKTHIVYDCQFCHTALPKPKDLPYGFYVICERCLKERKA
jgi:hypothetical protein